MSEELTAADTDERWLRAHAPFVVTDDQVDFFVERVAMLMSDLNISEKRARNVALGLVPR